MAAADTRRVTIPAPPDGGSATPPPRRMPEIVMPSDPPTAVAPAAATSAAAPAPAPTPAAPSQRVVIPAPGNATAKPARAPSAPTPQGPAKPPAKPAVPATDHGRSGWRRFVPSRRVVLSIVAVLLLFIAGVAIYGWSKFNSIERVDLAGALAEDNGTNYLIVGSDTRDGVDPDDPNAGAILGDNSVGGPERSDTILILRIDDRGARTLSVPRDLFVTISETGQRSRINAAFNGGPTRLIATLRDQLGLPIHHYLEVDFVSFGRLVDAVGGITIDFAHPAIDTHSGLNVPEAGPQNLDGTQALAYVRSRFYTEIIDGRQVPEGTGDIGRVVRQQAFLSAVMGAVGSERNPFTLMRIANVLSDGMRIDSDLSFFEALNLLRRMRGLDPAPNSLPTTGFRTSAGADVLRLVEGEAAPILADFGSTGSSIR